jgi:hypothetical protein
MRGPLQQMNVIKCEGVLNIKMANRLLKDAGEDEWHKECHRLFDEWFQKWF